MIAIKEEIQKKRKKESPKLPKFWGSNSHNNKRVITIEVAIEKKAKRGREIIRLRSSIISIMGER